MKNNQSRKQIKPGSWGISATIKAPTEEILRFAAYHLELGAHRIHIYLDDGNREAFLALKAHPKIRVSRCGGNYWGKINNNKRPKTHQVRQILNATHAYNKRNEVEWLAHIDVDEFLWPEGNLQGILEQLPPQVHSARIRPMELLSGSTTAYKAFIDTPDTRREIVDRLYPQFGEFFDGGFLSHIAGKLFIRTGMRNLDVKIHNVFLGDQKNPGPHELKSVALCHNHAKSWDDWIGTYRYRLEQGSYRKDLAKFRHSVGRLSKHEMFNLIEADNGLEGLRAFYDELCADSPDMRERLSKEGLLRICDLQLDAKIAKQFPGFR